MIKTVRVIEVMLTNALQRLVDAPLAPRERAAAYHQARETLKLVRNMGEKVRTVREDLNRRAENERERLREVAAAAQARCHHDGVLHWRGDLSVWPVRVCLNCGLEEVGTFGSYAGSYWTPRGYGQPVLGPRAGRVIEHTAIQSEFEKVRLKI